MKKVLAFSLLALALSIPTLPAAAQQAAVRPDTPLKISERNTPVMVEHEGADGLGARLSLRIKEILNSSTLFKVEAADTPKFRILVSTVSEFPSRPTMGSAYSVVWVFSFNDSMLRHYLAREVGVVTPDEVDAIATKIVERTDGMAAKYGYLFPEKTEGAE